jgi:hypothetical protein
VDGISKVDLRLKKRRNQGRCSQMSIAPFIIEGKKSGN